MKIRDVRTMLLTVSIPKEKQYISDLGITPGRSAAIVVVETDEGLTGYGEALGAPQVMKAMVEQQLKPLLLGEDPARALWVGREIEKLNFYWYESPLPDTDIEGLTELTRILDIPIAGAEYLYECNPTHFAPYLSGHVVDIIRADARRSITMAKKVADMCAGFHVDCELHSWGSIISKSANLHVMGAIKNCQFFEQPVPVERFETYAKDVVRIDSEGDVHMPTKPGIGVDLDWDDIDKRTIFRA